MISNLKIYILVSVQGCTGKRNKENVTDLCTKTFFLTVKRQVNFTFNQMNNTNQ